ncbi:hypothetical protein N2152v2_004967 [Parachlorella kessleri]
MSFTSPGLTNAQLEGSEELVAARMRQSPSLVAFMVELRNLVEQLLLRHVRSSQRTLRLGGWQSRSDPTRTDEQRLEWGSAGTPQAHPRDISGAGTAASRPAEFFRTLKTELDALGWWRISALSDDLSSFSLAVQDRRGRSHQATIALPPSYPDAPPTVAADLPAAFTPRWGPGTATLCQLAAQLEATLEGFQWLWDSLDDVDERAWVILDPTKPGAFPECRFMGAEAAVAPLRQKLHQNRGRWQADRLLRENLEAILEQALPSREAGAEAGQQEDISAECAICYAYRLLQPDAEAGAEGEAPDINCSNASCAKPFHRQCLVEWLNADTATRSSFNTLFGACPYCSDPITVRVL